MREITFETFLEQYLADISGQQTLNIHKLAKLSAKNHRITSPLVLYCLFRNKMDLLLKYINTNINPLLDELTKDNYLNDKYANHYSFKKIENSYRRRVDYYKNCNITKSLARANILALMREKRISTYRICKDLQVNPGNVNDYLKNDNPRKVSLKLVQEIYNYCLEIKED